MKKHKQGIHMYMYLKMNWWSIQIDRFHGGEGHAGLVDEAVHKKAQEGLAYDQVLVLIFCDCDDLLLSYVVQYTQTVSEATSHK